MQTNTQRVLLEWQAPSKLTHERSPRWYVGMSIASATIIAYGILSDAWSLSLTIALLAGLFFLIRNEEHKAHTIRILDIGIQFDEKMHIWSECTHFWILQGTNYHELHIERKRRLSGDIVIQTADIDPYVIRDLLSKYIPQIAHQKEKILDAIIRYCKL